jgi:hypothetical protein
MLITPGAVENNVKICEKMQVEIPYLLLFLLLAPFLSFFLSLLLSAGLLRLVRVFRGLGRLLFLVQEVYVGRCCGCEQLLLYRLKKSHALVSHDVMCFHLSRRTPQHTGSSLLLLFAALNAASMYGGMERRRRWRRKRCVCACVYLSEMSVCERVS